MYVSDGEADLDVASQLEDPSDEELEAENTVGARASARLRAVVELSSASEDEILAAQRDDVPAAPCDDIEYNVEQELNNI